MTATDWITPGMTVVVYHHHDHASHTASVQRLTATQIVLSGPRGTELRYRRDDGRKVGDHYGGGELRPIDDAGWLKQQQNQRQRRAVSKVYVAADALRHQIGDEGRQMLIALQDTVTEALKAFETQEADCG